MMRQHVAGPSALKWAADFAVPPDSDEHLDALLDAALRETFPAGDPFSLTLDGLEPRGRFGRKRDRAAPRPN